jgi:hypothetical protein
VLRRFDSVLPVCWPFLKKKEAEMGTGPTKKGAPNTRPLAEPRPRGVENSTRLDAPLRGRESKALLLYFKSLAAQVGRFLRGSS